MNFLTFILADVVTQTSDFFYHLFNSLAGRSWLLDNLIALPLDNEMVKAGAIGACFLATWFGQKTEAETERVRKILLVTLAASVFVIATTKTLSKTVFLPRPYIQSQKIYYLAGDQLVTAASLPYRVPLDPENQKMWQALQNGDVQSNDLGSFPSDHAGFYVTIAAGIWLASRSIGLFALLWTFLVILAGRIITGMHSPLDILVGSAIGVIILGLSQLIAKNKWISQGMQFITNWTVRQTVLSSALIFVAAYEVSSTLTHVRPLLKTGVTILKHLLGRGE